MWLDIAYHVGRLNRYIHNPSVLHWDWDVISRLLRYLKGTMNYGLSYCGYLAILKGYYDTNWISDTEKVKPTGWYRKGKAHW